MTHEQIRFVKTSWKLFRSMDAALVGDLFYSKLFTAHPTLRKMFPKQMEAQYVKLIDMISAVVSRIDDMESISAEVTALARRHVEYGVKNIHYRYVGDVLLWTLEKGLGKDWTPEVKEAWIACYHLLAETMMQAAVHEHPGQ